VRAQSGAVRKGAGAPNRRQLIDFWGLGYDIAERMGEEAHLDLAPMYEAQGGRFISVARAELASALATACVGVPTQFNLSIDLIAADGAGSIVTLSNGSQERFDLVVGADGLHSRVRALAFGPEAQFERFLDCYVAAFRLCGYRHRDALTFASHTVRGRQAARVSLRDDATVVMMVCRAELIDADAWPHGCLNTKCDASRP
jgi:2-polyprenyl-6-methoxyphenol hydroxylase-like FAD-dependent oxidoreductase